ncbi:MAG: hypothetical protein ACFFG0_13080 [Candidatus Thorarchaeota archaeon]
MEEIFEKLIQIRDIKKRRVFLERKGLSKPEIEKILEEVHIKIKGKKKFSRAKLMKFNREGLAQASSKYVAEYRTWKMRQRLGPIHASLDVGSGIGGDTIAMGMRWKVFSVEINPHTLDMQKHNVNVYNVKKNVDFIPGDILKLIDDAEFQEKIKEINCIFFDPSRRSQGKRTVKIEEYKPPLSLVEKLKLISENICVKAAPGVGLSYITSYDCDIEVISYKGEVKETVLWFGKFKINSEKNSIIATKLPEKISLVQESLKYKITLSKPKKYVYEPDPAFIKAHLIAEIAKKYTLFQMSNKIAYLTSDSFIDTPILKCYNVLAYKALDYNLINETLNELNLGKMDFKARGVKIDLKHIHNKVRSAGKNKGLIIFTRISNNPAALICKYTK